jgi:hypothetical protein
MAHGVKIDNTFLDLFDSTYFEYELHSPAYFGGSSDVIQNSLIFTVSVPSSERNAALLGHANHPSNDYGFITQKYAEIWADGSILFDGYLTVTESTDNSISFRVLINAIGELKNMLLKDINVATSVNLTVGQSPLNYAKATALNPENYDFIFFPVFNPEFEKPEENRPVIPAQWQNFYATGGQNFTSSAVTPFLKLDYVLRKMFETIGFTLDNQFQITPEKKRLVLYNNYDARQAGTFPSFLNLKNHLPQTLKCGEFLAKLCRLLTYPRLWMLLVKPWSCTRCSMRCAALPLTIGQIKCSPTGSSRKSGLKCLLKSAYKDYLKYSGRTYRYEQDFDAIKYKSIEKIETLTPPFLANEVYFEKTTNIWYATLPVSSNPVELTTQISPLKSATAKGEPFYNEMIAPLNEMVVINESLDSGFVPMVRVEGSTALKTNESPLMLMLYRGMQPITGPANSLYPHASLNVYNAKKNRCGTDAFSLHLTGEYGLGENCIGDWYSMLQRKKDLTARFDLSISDIRNFSFRKKVHVKGMDYFVKRLKGQISIKGVSATEADMCTTLI